MYAMMKRLFLEMKPSMKSASAVLFMTTLTVLPCMSRYYFATSQISNLIGGNSQFATAALVPEFAFTTVGCPTGL